MILNHPRSPRGRGIRLRFEPLEGRSLLSSTPASPLTIVSGHAGYTVSLAGPGQFHLGKVGKGQFGIELSGTTAASAVSVVQSGTGSKYAGSELPVARVDVASGQLGQFLGGGTVNLLGTLNVSGPIEALQLGAVGPKARIIAKGGLGSLAVSGAIHLGPSGMVHVSGDLAGTLQAGSIQLDGGEILVDRNLGGLSTGSLGVGKGGRFLVGDALGTASVSGDTTVSGGVLYVGGTAGALTFGHDVTVAPGGQIVVARDVTASATVGGGVALDAGQILIGRDLLGSLTINGDLTAVAGGNLTVGRDLTGGLSVVGDLDLLGGSLAIGRSLGSGGTSSSPGLGVLGNVVTSAGGSIRVGGNLDGFRVGGTVQGQGSPVVDLTVGLDLDNWSVAGGSAGLGGVNRFNVDVAKNLDGWNISHGLFDDFITAGVLINNTTVGADGPVAVFDTEIRAGVQITNASFNGDVTSDRPTNPAALRTRIVAGEDRSGNFEIGGNMVNVIVTGSLVDAVLAASVEPYGGDGSVQLASAPAPIPGSPDYYDAPAGGAYRGAANLGLPYAAPPFDPRTDPGVHDRVLPGSINRPFAPSPTKGPYPTQSTVLGGVITTAHANNSDYAGLFAADTSGVFVGTIPGS